MLAPLEAIRLSIKLLVGDKLSSRTFLNTTYLKTHK